MNIGAANTSPGGVRRVFYFLLAASLLSGGTCLARDLTTTNGDVFKSVSVLSKDSTGIDIAHDDGVAFLDYKSLSEADQKDFGFDPAAYAAAVKQRNEAARLRREQAELATLQGIARSKAQIAQANAQTQQTLQQMNQMARQVMVSGPDIIFVGYPVWDSSSAIAFGGSSMNFGMHHNGGGLGSGGNRRH
jgi:hypothetical protein